MTDVPVLIVGGGPVGLALVGWRGNAPPDDLLALIDCVRGAAPRA